MGSCLIDMEVGLGCKSLVLFYFPPPFFVLLIMKPHACCIHDFWKISIRLSQLVNIVALHQSIKCQNYHLTYCSTKIQIQLHRQIYFIIILILNSRGLNIKVTTGYYKNLG